MLSNVWQKVQDDFYQNVDRGPRRKGKKAVGMFGAGFRTFKRGSFDKDIANKIMNILTSLYFEEGDSANIDYNF